MPQRHVVSEGECLASIAWAYGFHPETVWSDPGNQQLRTLRGDGYVLQPGDVITVPDLRAKSVGRAAGGTHRFRRLAVPEKLNVALLDAAGAPRPNVAWKLAVDGLPEQSGVTDGDGKLQAWIPPAATEGTLTIADEPPLLLRLGHLRPVDTEAGVRARLANLGHLRSVDDDAAALREAIIRFQQSASLTPTGTMDADSRAALLAAHGS
jgi:putative peptidoglycan binding protein